MNKSKSYPALTDESLLSLYGSQSIKKSKSLSDIQKYDFTFDELFEGDGLLGIRFINQDDKVVIQRIIKNSVASETYGLYTGMIVVKVNNIDIKTYSYNEILEMINTSWFRGSVYIQFQKPIWIDLLTLLVKHKLLNYYDKFIELGVKSIEDFEYIEINDLHKMEMNETDIQKLMIENRNKNI
jgi:hypothetical protein